jgi:hypothetical protein
MSAQSSSAPAAARNNDIVDLTEGLSNLDMSGAEEDNNKETKDTCKSRKKKRNRANRRSTKSKKAKEQEAFRKLQEAKVDADAPNEGTFGERDAANADFAPAFCIDPLLRHFIYR